MDHHLVMGLQISSNGYKLVEQVIMIQISSDLPAQPSRSERTCCAHRLPRTFDLMQIAELVPLSAYSLT